ncbi:hypothetical protein SKAU_G00103960 [Synaphobranchus kaupii]|uniref:Reverse transcriptase domain-containing protein n=1 Tax=Synaphobranchus kaupii TaxID=118154 RepID=A0A9Q1J7R2_SYNKA|nr:hypothetical protein SKAU_G00103960 [Synaphobranchus kaupii]
MTAIRSLKSGKAPGQDNLNAELFKVHPELSAKLLQPLFTVIWEGKKIPDDWSKGVIIKIPKKEQCTEWQRQLYINFVDFEKAFDSIHRDSLWRILRLYGIPQQIIFIIKSFYTNFTCQVGNNNHTFEVKTGVRQGCVMSALLFIIAIDWVMKKTTEDQPRGIRWTLLSTLEDLDFAEKTSRLNTFAQQIGLKISLKKTEVMTLTQNPPPMQVDGTNLPTTEEFVYLGSIVRYDGGTGKDIKSRLSKARNIFKMLNNVWKSPQYSTNTKLKLYQSCLLSTLLYG